MKIKDLPKNTNLGGIKFKVPENHPECPLKEAYWHSQWGYEDGQAGVWCKESMSATRVYPIFLDKLIEVMEWEIIEENG